MLQRCLLAAFAAGLSLPAYAGDVTFEMFGTVASGSAPSGPFAGVTVGSAVHIVFDVTVPGTDIVAGHFTSYPLDMPSVLVEIGAASTGGGATSTVVNIADDFTTVDGVHLTFASLASGNRFDFEFTDCNGTTFSSTDPLANTGTWSAATFCSYNFMVHGAGASIDILPSTVSIFVRAPGQPFCAGDGSLADHSTACPCGNNGAPGRGCGHSFDANGALLAATGDIALDTVVLDSSFEPVSSFTLFMQHANAGDTVFHDGVLCAGNPLIRLRGRAAVAGAASFPNSNFANDSTTTLSARGGTFPGSGATMRYAAWYRNASSTFCPPATANVTNGWVITW